MDFRTARDDNERVGDDGPPVEVEDRDILTFLFFSGGADDIDEFRQSVSPGLVPFDKLRTGCVVIECGERLGCGGLGAVPAVGDRLGELSGHGRP